MNNIEFLCSSVSLLLFFKLFSGIVIWSKYTIYIILNFQFHPIYNIFSSTVHVMKYVCTSLAVFLLHILIKVLQIKICFELFSDMYHFCLPLIFNYFNNFIHTSFVNCKLYLQLFVRLLQFSIFFTFSVQNLGFQYISVLKSFYTYFHQSQRRSI